MDWKELDRLEQKALQCLYGGGSLRNFDAGVITRLQQLGLIEGKGRREQLSHLGRALMDFTHAEMRARLSAETRRDHPGEDREDEPAAEPVELAEPAAR